MIDNEYNVFNEVQKIEECKNYEAVQTYITNKETHTFNNESLITDEYGASKKRKKATSNKNDKNLIRKMIQKVSEVTSSLAGGIAATASVAIISVIILASVLISPPNIELLNLEVGYDYVSYSLYIAEMNQDLDYYSVVQNNFESYKFKLDEGENSNEIYNLRHNMKYDLFVIGISKENNEEIKYFEIDFYTIKELKYIKVQWVVEGNIVETDEIQHGEIPVYDGPTPIKESTGENHYAFKSWIETIDENGNITYTAEFELSTRTYIVNWVVEGKVVETDEIQYGEIPVYDGPTPIKESTSENHYVFKSWIETIDENGNITYTAEFELSTRTYIVNWVVEGKVVETDEIQYGEIPVYDGPTPIKEMTMEVNYEFVGWDKEIVAVIDNTTYTAVFNTIQHEYVATYNQVNAADIIINYDNSEYYVLSFNTQFNNSLDPRLSYKIILTDVFTGATYTYEGTDAIATINVDISATRLSITYENIGTYNEMEKVFDTITMPDELDISSINVEMSDDLTLVATDEYQLPLTIISEFANEEIYNSLTILINYNDSSSKEILIENPLINEKMLITIPVPIYCSSFTLNYTVDLLGANGHNPRIISGTKEYILESEFELIRTYADTGEYINARFLFKYHFVDQETTLAVKDTVTSTVTTMYAGKDYIEVYLDDSLNQQEYVYYLSDLDGVAKGTENAVTINMANVTGVYDFQYVNPGDAVVTFNEDETMNIYLNTTFETEDVDIWYLVRYTDYNSGAIYDIKYTESVAYLEYIPFSDYGIEYFVYKTVDGIEYQLKRVSVSGGIEITSTKTCTGEVQEIDGSSINIHINYYDYYNINSDSLVLLIDGNEYKVQSSEIVYDSNIYTFNYELDYIPNELILQYEKTFNDQMTYELISAQREIIGVQNKTMYLVLI